MFDNYYDSVIYRSQTGKDKFGSMQYSKPVEKLVRYVKGQNVAYVEGEKNVIKYKRTYHTPFEVKQGDILDSHLVSEVRPSRGIDGEIEFYIVGTV